MLHTPDGPAFPEYTELAERIVKGDGVWRGDPYLDLQVGVITRGRKVVGHRLEVWRWNEDGSYGRIGTWHPRESYRIPHDLAEMRADRPNAVSVLDRIDAHNEAKEAEHAREIQDMMAEQVERLAYRFVKEQGAPKTTFVVPGRKEA